MRVIRNGKSIVSVGEFGVPKEQIRGMKKGQVLQFRYREKKQVSLVKLEELAAAGFTQEAIAKKLGISTTLFRWRKAAELSFYLAWERGARRAGTFKEANKPRSVQEDEGYIPLLDIDHVIFEVLSKRRYRGTIYPIRKRVRHIREITGFDDRVIVHSLERLILNTLVAAIEGIVFTEYEVIDREKEAEKREAMKEAA